MRLDAMQSLDGALTAMALFSEIHIASHLRHEKVQVCAIVVGVSARKHGHRISRHLWGNMEQSLVMESPGLFRRHSAGTRQGQPSRQRRVEAHGKGVLGIVDL